MSTLKKIMHQWNSLSKTIAVVAGVCVAGVLINTPANAASREVKIDIGGESAVSKSVILPLNKAAIVELPKAAADVLVSQPGVVNAVVRSPRRVYLLGLQTGQTNAFFFDARGRQILNLEIQVERDTDLLRDLVQRLMPEARVQIEVVNDNLILRGAVNSSAEAVNIHDLAGRFVGDNEKVLNLLSIRQPDQVMLRVRIVEMQRSVIKQLGVDSDGLLQLDNMAVGFAAQNPFGVAGTSLGGLTSIVDTDGIGDVTDLDFRVNALEQTGLVRILAEPNLTAISGESANFLAGGEFPVPVGQDNGRVSIEFKEFGIGLGFTPIVLTKGRINLKIATEVSELTNENSFVIAGATIVDPDTNETVTTAGLQVPGLAVRRANTTVELPSGGSLVMAGLLQEDLRQTINGIPGLKDTPVLGQLFRSRDYQNNESELVIIVTPYLVNGSHNSKLSTPNDGFAVASDTEAVLLGKLVSTYGLSSTSSEQSSLEGPMGFILD